MDRTEPRAERPSASSANTLTEPRVKQARLFRPHWLLVASALAACGGPKAAPKAPSIQAVTRHSDEASRESVAITVYNSNFGLVREVRQAKLAEGRVELAFADVSAHIQPETVHIRSLDDAKSLSVLEQNYRYDLLSPQKLLEKFVGKKIRVARYNAKLGTDEIKDAEVLSIQGGPVLRIDGQIESGYGGRYLFPSVPENLISKPTLVWLLDSTQPNQKVEVSYLTSEMKWQADYVLVLAANDRSADLSGWVTLENRTGTSYKNAELKLVAGDVQRVAPPMDPMSEADYAYEMAPAAAPAPEFHEESLFEYHLYTLGRPTDLLNNEQKQVSLLEGHDLEVQKRLVLRGQEYWYRGRQGQVLKDQKVSAFVKFQNSEKNKLGMPLPKGTVRVYKASKSGALEFVGEDSIDHTPRDEDVEIKLGESFDVVADQKQMEYRAISSCAHESTWELSLRNHKDQAELVDVEEPTSGDYTIEQASHPYKKKDAHTFTFSIAVPARGEVTVTYRIRTRYC
jgi:hypothetical protein